MQNDNTVVDVNSLVKEIKQSFRLFMNGVASQSMRDKGLSYKINWGIPLTRLREMASRYEPSIALATALWQSDVRECKLLAMMLMPADGCDETTAKQWMDDCFNQEMAEMLAFHLLQKLPFAQHLVVSLLPTAEGVKLLCLFQLLSRLVTKGLQADEALANNLADKAVEALTGEDVALRHAALNCVLRCVDNGQPAFLLLQESLKKHKLDIF